MRRSSCNGKLLSEVQYMTAWRQIASKWIIRDQWMRLRADTCELANGQLIDPYYVIEEHDWVHVFAQDVDGKLLIVRQY